MSEGCGFSLIASAKTDRVCYMILPGGFSRDLEESLRAMSADYSCSVVLIDSIDWNDDLTPWPAPGVFKKAKPFGGRAETFLSLMTEIIIPDAERKLDVMNPRRILLGVSLSGLFAVWACCNTDLFADIVSISGSLWYDGFSNWLEKAELSRNVGNICLVLGEKEKNSKESRMMTVEEETIRVYGLLKAKSAGTVSFRLVEGTHFSPIGPRMRCAFDMLGL